MDFNKLLQIGLDKRNGKISDSWNELAIKHSDGLFSDGEQYRLWVRSRLRSNNTNAQAYSDDKVAIHNFKEEVEIKNDGTQVSKKLVEMSLEQSKDPEYLLNIHGYDPAQWELTNAKSKIWNGFSDNRGIIQLYATSISVKPKVNGFDFNKLIEEIYNVPSFNVESKVGNNYENRLLEIPFFDQHFGVSDYEYYKPTQAETIEVIQSKRWKEILIIVGQDCFHNDSFRGQTSNNTPIEKVNMIKAWEDAKKFYFPLIEQAIENSSNVKLIYSKGNHDESFSWTFVQLLKQRFPSITVNDTFIERKCHTFGKIFIGITHGDKARKNLHNLFQVEYPMEWAIAKVREIHAGHLHVEDAKDYFGTMVRTLATRNRTDDWHSDKGFVGAHKRFMLFEYSESELKKIHYV